MVKRKEWILLLAGGASALSLVFAAASLVIALIARISPPVSKYLTAEQNADVAAQVRSAWVLPACMIVFALLTAVPIVLRRPFLSSDRWRANSSGTGLASLWILGLISAVVGFFFLRSVSLAVSVMQTTPGPMTESPAFAGLGSNLGMFGLFGAMWSTTLFEYWWRASRASEVVQSLSNGAASASGV